MPPESSDLDAETEIDRLYQLPLDAFVEARNALAVRLKSSGDRSGAARVKALARPNVPAWAANQVYWRARSEFDALLASVERLQDAQLRGSPGSTELRDAMKARREAQDLVLRSAVSLLTSGGHGTNPGTVQRVSNTLEALAAAGAGPAQARPGRLAEDLEPPGFDAFAAMAGAQPPMPRTRVEPVAERPRPRAVPESAVAADGPPLAESADPRRAEDQERLRAELADAERGLERARREAREAAGALSVAEKRAEGARGELADATRRVERAKDRATAMADDEAAARLKAEELAASRDAAEAERDAALRALRALD